MPLGKFAPAVVLVIEILFADYLSPARLQATLAPVLLPENKPRQTRRARERRFRERCGQVLRRESGQRRNSSPSGVEGTIRS